MHEKWSEGQYIAYFQAFTNTHAPVEVLKEKYEPVLKRRWRRWFINRDKT